MMFFIIFYSLVLLTVSGSSNILSSLVAAEVLSWIFIQMLNVFDSIKYLVVQSMFFLFSVMGLFWLKPMLIAGLVLKMGLPPFHMWMVRLLATLKKASFFLILTLHKLLPLLILAKVIMESNNILLLSLFLSILGGMTSNLSSLFLVLGLSSMTHSFWMVISSLAAASLLITYWTLYTFLSFVFIFSISPNWMLNSSVCQTLMTTLGWLLMSGMPPFIVFWLKAHVTFAALNSIGFVFMMVVLVNSVLLLSAYYRTWHFTGLMIHQSWTKVQMAFMFFVSFYGIF